MDPKPHLIRHGKDLGEISAVSLEGTYDDIDFYYVWVKRPETDED